FFEDTGSVTVSAGVEPKKSSLAVRVIMRELDHLKRTYVSKSELRRAKDYYLGQLLLGLEDTLDHALWFGERVLYGEDVPDLEEIKRQIEAVDQGDLQNLAKRFFKTPNVHLALIGPIDSKFEKRLKAECVCP
ncbi:MAG: insulinase family protein, partial [Candidatus Omnitrophica bacterium]|nr:insulinase family protein [Candidatus Omnitrophota bacterium]